MRLFPATRKYILENSHRLPLCYTLQEVKRNLTFVNLYPRIVNGWIFSEPLLRLFHLKNQQINITTISGPSLKSPHILKDFILGRLAKYFLKLILKRIEKSLNFSWLCHFLIQKRLVNFTYCPQTVLIQFKLVWLINSD